MSKSNKKVSTIVHPQPANAPSAIDVLADSIIQQIDAMESSMTLDITIRPNDKAQIRSLNRVSVKALQLGAAIVASDPTRFPDFQGMAAAADYATAMGRVATRVIELGTHVQKSVQNTRYASSIQVLALYKIVKALGEVAENEVMREKVPELAAELAPKHRGPKKPKQTKAEKAEKRAAAARARKVAKAQQILAENGVTPAAPAAQQESPPAAAPVSPTPAAHG
jgi:hypothetical protein